MVAVTASEFARNLDLYEEKAQREPIAITSNDRTTGYFVSARDYEEYQRVKSSSRRVYHISELPKSTLEGIKNARMDPAYDHLNRLLDEE